ncbi:N-acetyltransferase [Actinopolymorpha rutila]|uniref:GNAT superfamily N-acetyltransferase n=1 Tax=Actinopolymorpha rutila TaxID=446787 RepID=A0A852ZVJ4_9ACTN|nr:N-acetyltransferase [Actinopolymorpha rutila]NYH92726.1 GNAT superfamily N-acetyltransferase [Actinopolymorpha rutila]
MAPPAPVARTLPSGATIQLSTVAQRPEFAHPRHETGWWPDFMRHNNVSDAFYWRAGEEFPHTCVVATEGERAVAYGVAVPLALGGRDREALPDGGWEKALVWAFHDAANPEAQPNSACALDVSVAGSLRGQGLSRLMLQALRVAVRDAGLARLVAPVRPTWKDREPRTPMAAYAARLRSDGLPYDPWLRTHVRAGGQITGVAPTSWVVHGSLRQWREWTGLPFDRTGDVDVPGALVPVHCDLDGDHAVYVEPNVWVRHDVSN